MHVFLDSNDKDVLRYSKRMLLIVGKSCTGKDTFADKYCSITGCSKVISYTTRPPRNDTEFTHIFITPEEAKSFSYEDKVAFTTINDYEYFATKQQIDHNQVYIIDPSGMIQLFHHCPDTKFYVLYLYANEGDRAANALKRGGVNGDLELFKFYQRNESERLMFDEFEKQVAMDDFKRFRFIKSYPNLMDILVWRNMYIEGDFDMLVTRVASQILGDIRQEFSMNLDEIDRDFKAKLDENKV